MHFPPNLCNSVMLWGSRLNEQTGISTQQLLLVPSKIYLEKNRIWLSSNRPSQRAQVCGEFDEEAALNGKVFFLLHFSVQSGTKQHGVTFSVKKAGLRRFGLWYRWGDEGLQNVKRVLSYGRFQFSLSVEIKSSKSVSRVDSAALRPRGGGLTELSISVVQLRSLWKSFRLMMTFRRAECGI